MTVKEAINRIRIYIDLIKFDLSTGEEAYLHEDTKKFIEALEVAIKELEERNDYKRVRL